MKSELTITKRRCLKCGKEFQSAGPGNRICVVCNKNNSRRGQLKLSKVMVREPN
jgi:hypothetical protein